MEIIMFGVFRTNTDGCTYTCETLLFVTPSEQTAKDAVTLAELEQEEALKLHRPSWSSADISRNGADWCTNLLDEYVEKLAAIFTVDVPKEPGHKRTYVDPDPNVSYYYEKVDVR